MTIDWKKVVSDFSGRWEMCYGCGQKNPIGLKLVFTWDGKGARSEFTPRKEHQGWPGVLHGGVMANIIDEAASWALYFEGLYVVTAKMEILYRHPATIDQTLKIESDITMRKEKNCEAWTRIIAPDGTLIAEGRSLHVNIDKSSKIKSKYNFAAIFDMDGVLVDTADFHFESWQFAFRKAGVDFKREEFTGLFGQRNDAIIRSVMKKDLTGKEIEQIATDKEEYFRARAAGNVRALPGAVGLVKELAGEGIKMAVASSAPTENIHLLLDNLGIREYFKQIVQGREVLDSKPSPLIFLLAARKLGMPPKHCIVFEDAVVGVLGANRAGMHSVAVTTTNKRENLKNAEIVVDSLAEVSVSSLVKLTSQDPLLKTESE